MRALILKEKNPLRPLKQATMYMQPVSVILIKQHQRDVLFLSLLTYKY